MSGAFGLSLRCRIVCLIADGNLPRRGHPGKPHPDVAAVQGFDELHDWADGAQRAFLQYRADATDAAKGAEEAFSSLYSGMDSAGSRHGSRCWKTGRSRFRRSVRCSRRSLPI
ncbi:MAG: phage tail tape measure C-terminal domain-containing protein [Bilophila wadsworthia]